MKFIDKIEGDDANRKRVEIKKMNEWDLNELRKADRFDVTILGSELPLTNAEVQFRNCHQGSCIFYVPLKEGQTLGGCKVEHFGGRFRTRLVVQSRIFLENKIQKNKVYPAICLPDGGGPGPVKLYVKFVRQKK